VVPSAVFAGLFGLDVGAFYIQLASESDRPRVLRAIAEHARPEQRIFAGVIDPIDSRVETAEEVRDRVLEAAEFIDPGRLGTCDDCGFAPFGDDTSTTRDTAFAKIRARVAGTELAAWSSGSDPVRVLRMPGLCEVPGAGSGHVPPACDGERRRPGRPRSPPAGCQVPGGRRRDACQQAGGFLRRAIVGGFHRGGDDGTVQPVFQKGGACVMRSPVTDVTSSARCPPWSRPGEALRLLIRGVTVRPCVPVAAVVGCVLSAINEGSQVASGHAGWLTWVRIGLNFVVPFLVSSYGYLTAARVPDRHPSQRAAG
jgi:hypothetical protein